MLHRIFPICMISALSERRSLCIFSPSTHVPETWKTKVLYVCSVVGIYMYCPFQIKLKSHVLGGLHVALSPWTYMPEKGFSYIFVHSYMPFTLSEPN